MSEEGEKYFLVLLLEELNSLYPLNLCTNNVFDRFMEEDVFDEGTMDHTDLALISASHLANIMRHINQEAWKITDLTRPGWRINAESVEVMTCMATAVDWDTTTVVLHLSDNSV